MQFGHAFYEAACKLERGVDKQKAPAPSSAPGPLNFANSGREVRHAQPRQTCIVR
jgi:hypothetical protein